MIFGVVEPRAQRESFNVEDEGTRPHLIVEVVSPVVRENDVDKKVVQYHRVGVPYYLIVDQEEADGPRALIGYQYTPLEYVPMPRSRRGRIWLDAFKVWIDIEDNVPVFFDGRTNEKLLGARATAEALQRTTEQLQAERRAREESEAKVRELEAMLQRMQGDGPSSTTRESMP